MDDRAVLLSLAVVGVATTGSGLALLVLRRARLAGACWCSWWGSLVATVALAGAERDGVAERLLVAASCSGCRPALMAYPRLRWRRLDEVAWLVGVLGPELAAVLWWGGTDGAATLAILGGCGLLAHIWWRIETGAETSVGHCSGWRWPRARCGLLAGFAEFAMESGPGLPYAFLVLALVGPAMVVGVALPEIVDVRGVTCRSWSVTVCVIAVTTVFVAAVSLLDMAGVADPSSARWAWSPGSPRSASTPPGAAAGRRRRGAVRRPARPAGRRQPGGRRRSATTRSLALRAIREALVLPYAALTTPDGELGRLGHVVDPHRGPSRSTAPAPSWSSDSGPEISL